MSVNNLLLLTQLLLDYTLKMQEIGILFRRAQAEGRDVTQEEIDGSKLALDAQIARTQEAITKASPGAQNPASGDYPIP